MYILLTKEFHFLLAAMGYYCYLTGYSVFWTQNQICMTITTNTCIS